MRKLKSITIDAETGEIINEEDVNMKNPTDKTKNLCKKIVDEMLERASKGEKLDSDMLYKWCKIVKEINMYGQIRLVGAYRDINYEDNMTSDDVYLTGMTIKVFKLTHPFSGFIMKRDKSKFLEGWEELYSEIGIGNSQSMKSKLKKFLVSHNIVRDFKIGGNDGKLVKRLIVNPFIYRGSAYTAQISTMVYQDFIKEGVNINCYPLRWLQAMGYIKETK
ncbi:MAG: hypothetical protein ACRCX2_11325 [Paraclostridium sp.]